MLRIQLKLSFIMITYWISLDLYMPMTWLLGQLNLYIHVCYIALLVRILFNDYTCPYYRKNPKISDTRKFAVITLKVEQDGFSWRVMHPKDAEGVANSVDPDQTAPVGAVWSGSALFAQICLSENLGTLRFNSQIETLLLEVYFEAQSGTEDFCIFWMHKPHCSSYWITTAVISGVPIFL